MDRPSYMGIAQMFAAAGQPDGLKAIFPQVPGADVYRDVVAFGGQIDAGFIPLWLGLVTVTGLIPPTTPPTDLSPLKTRGPLIGGAGAQAGHRDRVDRGGPVGDCTLGHRRRSRSRCVRTEPDE
jgi:hypothetical protein